ncbi:hypothetical protein [Sinanaerobacter sp. ZZT-01]|uniref:hypothetical protein n=1 Tax=Sinanaerobacter sp. ZZT-01 TaxID=3111540 RepID=UPI002D793712|nr:hypothetical protein [Sinanaerobacter sp. ZZT-01]WRR93051.1 hypothetical protein U5921_13590 [Sinanaerobacter sp. ZZT-01]
MMERNKPSAFVKRDAIYNPLEGKWEKRLNSKYLGDLEPFSLEREITSKISDVKDKALSGQNKVRDFTDQEAVKKHVSEFRSSMKASVQRLKEWSEETFMDEDPLAEENEAGMIQDREEETEKNFPVKESEGNDAEYEETGNQELDHSEEKQDYNWLKLLLAAIGLILAIVSN